MTEKFTLIETLAGEPRFSKFTSYCKMSGADLELRGPGQFTVFVPSDEAFAKIPDVDMNALLNENGWDELKALLLYHVVPGKIMAASIGSEPVRLSVTGEAIKFIDYRGLKVNGNGVLRRNLEATNGVIHSLDTVLTRPAPSNVLTFPLEIDTTQPFF